MEHRRCRNADLRRPGGHGFQEIEIASLDRGDMADLGVDMHGRRLEADLAAVVPAEFGDEIAIGDGDSSQALQEIDVEIGAPEFAIGDALQPDIRLCLDDLPDAIILDRAERLGRELARKKTFPRLRKARRAKIAADMVGAKRRLTTHRCVLPAISRRRASPVHDA